MACLVGFSILDIIFVITVRKLNIHLAFRKLEQSHMLYSCLQPRSIVWLHGPCYQVRSCSTELRACCIGTRGVLVQIVLRPEKSHCNLVYKLSRRDVTRSHCRMERFRELGTRLKTELHSRRAAVLQRLFSACTEHGDTIAVNENQLPRRRKQGLSALDGRTVSLAAAAAGTGCNMPYNLNIWTNVVKQAPLYQRTP